LLLFAVVLIWKWHRELMWNQKRLIPKDIAERWQHKARCKSEHELNRVAVVGFDRAPWRLARGSGKLDSVIPQ
jgi:hypothetical protein